MRDGQWWLRPRNWAWMAVGFTLYGAAMWVAWMFVLPSYVIRLGLLPFRALAWLFAMILGLSSGG